MIFLFYGPFLEHSWVEGKGLSEDIILALRPSGIERTWYLGPEESAHAKALRQNAFGIHEGLKEGRCLGMNQQEGDSFGQEN